MKKLLRISIILLVSVIAFHATLHLTDNLHFYNVIQRTVLKGRIGPSIDEYIQDPYRKIKAGKHQPWQITKIGNFNLSPTIQQELERLKTTAFLIIKNKKIIHEQYWQGYYADSITNSWSMAKSFVSMLVGAAIQDGKIQSVNQKVGDFIPEYTIGDKKQITIKHLLTMTSGIAFGENYINPFGFMAKALYGTNIRKLTLSSSAGVLPGKVWKYQGGNTLLLSLIIETATGQKISNYFSQKIWQLIGAKQDALWSLDKKNGEEKSYCCFNSTARDFARLGQLYLNGGIWNNTEIVSPHYIKSSITPVKIPDGNGDIVEHYGYAWWLTNYKNLQVYYARGINGQYVIVVPEKEFVIVRLGRKRNKKHGELHPRDIFVYIDAALQIKS